jgi:hypothetical protein
MHPESRRRMIEVQERPHAQYDAIRPAEQVGGGLYKANDEWNPGRWKALRPLLPRL